MPERSSSSKLVKLLTLWIKSPLRISQHSPRFSTLWFSSRAALTVLLWAQSVCGLVCWNRVDGRSLIMWLQQAASAYKKISTYWLPTLRLVHTKAWSRTVRKLMFAVVWFWWFLRVIWDLFSFLGDAFPAGSTPFLSGYPGPSSLTPDPAYRSSNPSGLQMAQLWASHAHEGKRLPEIFM